MQSDAGKFGSPLRRNEVRPRVYARYAVCISTSKSQANQRRDADVAAYLDRVMKPKK